MRRKEKENVEEDPWVTQVTIFRDGKHQIRPRLVQRRVIGASISLGYVESHLCEMVKYGIGSGTQKAVWDSNINLGSI